MGGGILNEIFPHIEKMHGFKQHQVIQIYAFTIYNNIINVFLSQNKSRPGSGHYIHLKSITGESIYDLR